MQALLIIDMQMDMQHRLDAGIDHVNGDAPARIGALAAAFRDRGLPVLHVRHAEDDPASPVHPQAPGHAAMPCAQALDGEPVFVKRTSSGFASTNLADYLRGAGIDALAVAGAVAGYCVNSTVRAGADLGLRLTVVRDAVLGFGMPGGELPARTVFDVTMALLASDFARVADTADVLGAIGHGPGARPGP